MKKGRGRTSRIRRRKLSKTFESRGVNESYKPEFIQLRKWLKDRKFEDTNLIPASFPGTGRGLMSKTSLRVAASSVSAAGSVHLFSCRKACWGPVSLEALPGDFTEGLYLPRLFGAGSGESSSPTFESKSQRAENPRAGVLHFLQRLLLLAAASVFRGRREHLQLQCPPMGLVHRQHQSCVREAWAEAVLLRRARHLRPRPIPGSAESQPRCPGKSSI